MSCPIIFLTARIEDCDKIEGFAVGGDDYVCPQYDVSHAVLHTARPSSAPTSRISYHLQRACFFFFIVISPLLSEASDGTYCTECFQTGPPCIVVPDTATTMISAFCSKYNLSLAGKRGCKSLFSECAAFPAKAGITFSPVFTANRAPNTAAHKSKGALQILFIQTKPAPSDD